MADDKIKIDVEVNAQNLDQLVSVLRRLSQDVTLDKIRQQAADARAEVAKIMPEFSGTEAKGIAAVAQAMRDLKRSAVEAKQSVASLEEEMSLQERSERRFRAMSGLVTGIAELEASGKRAITKTAEELNKIGANAGYSAKEIERLNARLKQTSDLAATARTRLSQQAKDISVVMPWQTMQQPEGQQKARVYISPEIVRPKFKREFLASFEGIFADLKAYLAQQGWKIGDAFSRTMQAEIMRSVLAMKGRFKEGLAGFGLVADSEANMSVNALNRLASGITAFGSEAIRRLVAAKSEWTNIWKGFGATVQQEVSRIQAAYQMLASSLNSAASKESFKWIWTMRGQWKPIWADVKSQWTAANVIPIGKQEVESVNRSLASMKEGWLDGIRSMGYFISKLYVAYYLVRRLTSAFVAGIRAVDQMRLSAQSMAGAMLVAAPAMKFEQALANSHAILEKIFTLTPRFVGSARELQILAEALVTFGVKLDLVTDKGQREFLQFANTLALITQGQNFEIQAFQEIRALMQGQNFQGAMLARRLQAAGIVVQDMVPIWAKQGTLIENINRLLQGYAKTTAVVSENLSTQASTLKSILVVSLAKAFGWSADPRQTTGLYADLRDTIRSINRLLLDEHGFTRTQVQLVEVLRNAWDFVKTPIEVIIGSIKLMNSLIEGIANRLSTVFEGAFQGIGAAAPGLTRLAKEFIDAIETTIGGGWILKIKRDIKEEMNFRDFYRELRQSIPNVGVEEARKYFEEEKILRESGAMGEALSPAATQTPPEAEYLEYLSRIKSLISKESEEAAITLKKSTSHLVGEIEQARLERQRAFKELFESKYFTALVRDASDDEKRVIHVAGKSVEVSVKQLKRQFEAARMDAEMRAIVDVIGNFTKNFEKEFLNAASVVDRVMSDYDEALAGGGAQISRSLHSVERQIRDAIKQLGDMLQGLPKSDILEKYVSTVLQSGASNEVKRAAIGFKNSIEVMRNALQGSIDKLSAIERPFKEAIIANAVRDWAQKLNDLEFEIEQGYGDGIISPLDRFNRSLARKYNDLREQVRKFFGGPATKDELDRLVAEVDRLEQKERELYAKSLQAESLINRERRMQALDELRVHIDAMRKEAELPISWPWNEKEVSLLKDLNAEAQRYEQEIERIKKAQEEYKRALAEHPEVEPGVGLNEDEAKRALDELRAIHERNNRKILESHSITAQATANAWRTAMSGTAEIIRQYFRAPWEENLNSLKDLWNAFLEVMYQSFADMLAEMVAEWIRKSAMMEGLKAGMAGVGQFLSGLLGLSAVPSAAVPAAAPTLIAAAKGGILPGEFIPFKAFAAGGIVNSPTMGLIAEGGAPEAVIPLSGGAIPVKMLDNQPSNTQQVNINFNISTIDATGFANLLASKRGMITSMIRTELANAGALRDAMRRYVSD